jgi:hypothetical protein
MKRGKPVLIWRVDLPFLHEEDWKYEGSKAREGHGGRTHTFGIQNPKTVISKAILYQAPEVSLSQGKPSLIDPAAGAQ